MKLTNAEIWWGPPKKFSTEREERRVSWLELFYDLVYVIAISRITHHLSAHLTISGLLDYIYLFTMIFWGWLNGSLHHDIHGSSGLRTNLMTLWQMMIVAALVVTFSSPPETLIFNGTIAILVMQLYITYLWWSVGIYDKVHRKLNIPYTICFLISFALLFATLFVEAPYIRILFYLSLVANYMPPFLLNRRLIQSRSDFTISSSMTERLGLFTIILFGEVVLGVINGISELKAFSIQIWINFGLAILIVFALWWIFFSMIADRESKKGFLRSNIMAMTYIPTLMALGMVGVGFDGLFHGFEQEGDLHSYWIKIAFGAALAGFLLGIWILAHFLDYPEVYLKAKKRIRQALLFAAAFLLFITISNLPIPLYGYLLLILIFLLAVIVIISKNWLILELKKMKQEVNTE